MPTYYDSQNQPHVLTKPLGRGGEGTVYACENNFQIVAKIYHEPIGVEKAKKLRWMAAHHDEQLLKVAAWVIDVLTDAPNGKVVGFLMPNVRAKEIHELYSLKSRRIHFPEATWHFLIHTAANLARAFHSLHKRDHVIGDVNHGNCVVLANGTVKLIDCDSYSIATEKMRYSCEVGVTTHLPPELQGIKLRGVERKTKHDNFGLAVIIFQLLFLGRHPFSGNFLGGEDKSIEDAIREHLFAYGKDAKIKLIAQPPGSLSLSAVSPAVANLFERAFTKDFIRPEPREWIEALEDLAESLEQCSLHPGHLFYENLAFCPWCEIESQTGLTVFPFIANDAYLKDKHKKPFNIVTVENLISSFNIKPNLSIRMTENFLPKDIQPSPIFLKEKDKLRNQKIALCSIYTAGLFFFYLFLPSSCVFIFSLLTAIILYSFYRKNAISLVYNEESSKLQNLQDEWNKIENIWSAVSVTPVLAENITQVRQKLQEYSALNGVDNADADEVKPTVTNAIENTKFTEINHQIEREITGLLSVIRAGSVKLRSQQQDLLSKSKKLAHEIAQSKSNIKFLDNNLPIGVFLVLISLGMPFVSLIVNNFNSRPDVEVRSISTTSTSKSYPTPKPSAAPNSGNNYAVIPDAKITDKEIAALSSYQKSNIITEILRMSDSYKNNDPANAESLLKFGLRFDDKNLKLLTSFGNFLYDQKRYKESVEYFNRAKIVDGNNDSINFLIGINYLGLKKYTLARDVFIKLTTGTMRTSESFYNLGVAYYRLENYSAAANAYRQALEIHDDIETLYQLGITLNKLGDKDGVIECYKNLLGKDDYRASRFKKTIGKSVNLDTPPDVIYSENPPKRVTSIDEVPKRMP